MNRRLDARGANWSPLSANGTFLASHTQSERKASTILKELGAPRVAELSGLDRVSVWRCLHKGAIPHARHLDAYLRIALTHARRGLRGIRPPRDQFGCLAAYSLR